MLYDVNKNNKKWRKLYGKIDSKGKDVEILLRLCAMEYYVIFSETKQEFFMGRYEETLLDDFSEMVIGFDEDTTMKYKKCLEKFLDRFDIKKTHKKVTTLDSLFAIQEKAGLDFVITDSICEELERTEEFNALSRQGTMSDSRMKKRWKVAYEQLSKYDKNTC